jgi:hypothetical protein
MNVTTRIQNVFVEFRLIIFRIENMYFWDVKDIAIDKAGILVRMVHEKFLRGIYIGKLVLDMVFFKDFTGVKRV